VTPRLRITLPPNWIDVSDQNPEGPPSYCRGDLGDPGVLQLSTAIYEGADSPNPSAHDLVELATDGAKSLGPGLLLETDSGTCALGTYGSATIQLDGGEWARVWHVSDGRNFVIATLVGRSNHATNEVAQAEQIVKTLTLPAEVNPWWKFW
jgi:hypothetical protein